MRDEYLEGERLNRSRQLAILYALKTELANILHLVPGKIVRQDFGNALVESDPQEAI
jgi:hypothetical protein